MRGRVEVNYGSGRRAFSKSPVGTVVVIRGVGDRTLKNKVKTKVIKHVKNKSTRRFWLGKENEVRVMKRD